MNPFGRLPGPPRAAPGLEWAVWRRLPAILFWGSALPLAVAALRWWLADAATEAAAMLTVYTAVGVVVLHWTLVVTVGFGCLIVRVMKGPAYVADAYPPAERGAPPLE